MADYPWHNIPSHLGVPMNIQKANAPDGNGGQGGGVPGGAPGGAATGAGQARVGMDMGAVAEPVQGAVHAARMAGPPPWTPPAKEPRTIGNVLKELKNLHRGVSATLTLEAGATLVEEAVGFKDASDPVTLGRVLRSGRALLGKYAESEVFRGPRHQCERSLARLEQVMTELQRASQDVGEFGPPLAGDSSKPE